MESARVVITGLGAVSPLGLSAEEMWSGLRAGRCGVGRLKAFDPTGLPCELVGEVPPYRIQDYVPKAHRKAIKLMCRDIELAVIAAADAIAGSGLVTKGIDPERVNIDPTRMGINVGAGMVSCDMAELGPAVVASTVDGHFDIHKWGKQGLQLITPLWLLKYLPNMLACHISIIHDIQGPSNTITCAEASAYLAIAEAAQVLARGSADIAVAGGAETRLHPLLLIRQTLLHRATLAPEHAAETACRPFDADAQGSVFGEGAGMVVLETLDHARERGARILAELVGIGQSHSINPAYERLEPDGMGLRMAIEAAMADAEIEPRQLDLVIPHGLGVPEDDRAEATAIVAALGPAAREVPVWPTKSMLTTTGAACGALDLVAAVRAITDSIVPAAKNFARPAQGCDLNIATEPRQGRIRHTLCCGYTHGGQTAALVIKRFEEGGDAK
jgi:3-oxoacyl-[acyl-carrier-protein] synthase II